MKQTIVIGLMFLTIACNMGQNTPSENNKKLWDVLKADGSTLMFQDKSQIKTRLYDMNYLETLKDSLGNPYFVVSGRTCNECDENIAIFIISPKDTLKPLSELPKYTYPGKEYDYDNNQLNFESKLYTGNCINSSEKSVCLIWVQKAKDSRNKLDSSMSIVDVFNEKIRERHIKPQTHEYSSILQSLKNCREIKGVETTSEP